MQSVLRESTVPRHALPYTELFSTLKKQYETKLAVTVADVDFWRMISSVGKSGGLGVKGQKKKASRTPTLTAGEQLEILRLFPDGIGNRDHLPYTPKFDEIHRRFTNLTGKTLSKHEFWRVLDRTARLSRKPTPVFAEAPLGGLAQDLVLFLQRQNPWWLGQPANKVEPFRRWAYSEAVDRLNSNLAKIVVLRGSRRVGKSMIESQLIEDLLLLGQFDPSRRPVSPERILYVQFDEAPGLGGLTNPIETIVRWYEQNVLKSSLNAAAKRGEPAYLFFDEVQNLPAWSAQLKILADHSDARILVTGSSALRISEGHDNLAGRMTVIELGPLRLTEIAGIRRLGQVPSYASAKPLEEWKTRAFWLGLVEHGKKYARIRDEAFRFFSRFGGYPLCHSTTEKNIDTLRQQLISEVITKTIEHDPGHKPRTPTLDSAFVRQVLRLVCRYAGQAVLNKRFAEEIQAILELPVPHSRVQAAISFLADSLLVGLVQPIEMLGKRQSHPSKLCVCDHFVRDGMLQETLPIDPDALKDCDEAVSGQVGHIIESIAGYYLKGIPGVELSWFPERANEPEVDLVITIGTNRIPVEAKYRASQESRDYAGIEAFCAKRSYSADFGIVITQRFAGLVAPNTIAIPMSTFLLLR